MGTRDVNDGRVEWLCEYDSSFPLPPLSVFSMLVRRVVRGVVSPRLFRGETMPFFLGKFAK
jgi:hypothetical protein